MSRSPFYFRSKRRNVDLAPMLEEPFEETRADVFDLIPPRVETLGRPEGVTRFESAAGLPTPTEAALVAEFGTPAEPAADDVSLPPPVLPTPEPAAAPAIEATTPEKSKRRGSQPVDMTDLSRLSIDTEGRLYWDGKPVETHRRLAMSRGQLLAATVIGLFVVVGGLAAAIQGSSAAYDWGCRLGWVHTYCPAAPALQTPRHPDLPA